MSNQNHELSQHSPSDMRQWNKKYLYKKCLQHCEFCDKICYNRFELMVHNKHHMIIPLTKINIFQCPVCRHCFTNQNLLDVHTYNKHGNNSQSAILETYNLDLKEESLDDDNHYDIENVKLNLRNDSNEMTSKILRSLLSSPVSESDFPLFETGSCSIEFNSNVLDSACPVPISGFPMSEADFILPDTDYFTSKLNDPAPKEVISMSTPNFTNRSDFILLEPDFATSKSDLDSSKLFPNMTASYPFHPSIHSINRNTAERMSPPTISISEVPVQFPSNESLQPSQGDRSTLLEDMSTYSLPTYNYLVAESDFSTSTPTIPTITLNAATPASDIATLKLLNPNYISLHPDQQFFNNPQLFFESEDVVIKEESSDGLLESLESESFTEAEPKNKCPQTTSPLKFQNLIMFEDDLEHDIVKLNDVENVKGPIEKDCAIQPKPNAIQTKSRFKKVCKLKVNRKNVEADAASESVHYDDLMTSGIVQCQFCPAVFPNSYLLIQHELVHLRPNIKVRRHQLCFICNAYIAGNHFTMDKHFKNKHELYIRLKSKILLKTCSECSLSYTNERQHIIRYHTYVCDSCKARFVNEKGLQKHQSMKSCLRICPICKYIAKSEEDSKWHKARMHLPSNMKQHVCKVCYVFLKNSSGTQYKNLGEHWEAGKRQTCCRCNKSYFVVYIVEVVGKWDDQVYASAVRVKKVPNKGITNEERLIKMKKRLKMLSMLNK